VSGDTYQLQFKTNITDSAWHNLGAEIVASSTNTTVTDSTTTNKSRFYRVEASTGNGQAVSQASQQLEIGPASTRTRRLYPAPAGSGSQGSATDGPVFYPVKVFPPMPIRPIAAPTRDPN
jgi:hypothetical protein